MLDCFDIGGCIIILGTVLLFYIQEVEVSGNEYCDSQEIVECVQNDKLSKNSLYVLAKYSLGQEKKPECLDTLKVSMKNPWTLKITVKEKTMVGCVKSGKKYSYFDQTGLVVNETEVKDSKIPVVSGLKIKKNKLYSQIKTTNQTKFSEIVEACGESQRYGNIPGKDICKGSADLYGFWKRKSMPWKSSIRRTDRSDQTNLKKAGR